MLDGLKKTRMMIDRANQMRKKFDDILSHLDTIHKCDTLQRWTDIRYC